MTSLSLVARFAAGGKHGIRGMLIALLVFVITLAAVVANVALHRIVEDSTRAEVLLLQLHGFAYRLSAFEWQAVGEREMSSKIVAGVQDAQADMKRTMASLEQLDANAGNLRPVRQTYDAYSRAMTEEFGLIRSGNFDEARRVDEERVDPAFDAFTQALSSTGAAYRAQAQQMGRLALLGTVLILLLAIATVAVLVWRTQKAQAASAAAAAERRALFQGQEELRLFADNVPSMTASFDKHLRCVFANQRYADFFGLGKADIIGKHVRQILGEDVYREVEGYFVKVLQGLAVTYERTFAQQDGKSQCLEVRLVPHIGDQGKIMGLFAVAQDITERKETEDRIVHLNRVYAVLSGINTLIVRVRDRDQLFTQACRIAVEAGGFRMSMIALVDRGAAKIVPVASAGKDEELLAAIQGLLASSQSAPKTMVGRAIREKRPVVANDSLKDPQVLFGSQYAAAGVRSMAVLPLMVADEAIGVLALYAGESEFFAEEELKLLIELTGDIAFAIDHIEKQERLDYLAYYDVLTGLANRTLFLERLAQHMRSAAGGHEIALFLIDLERFKNINDSLGRPAGDALLRQVAQWLTHTAGDANLLARVGADHFAMVMPEVKKVGGVMRLLEKWMEAFLQHPFHLNDAVFRIAVKAGVALFPDDGADADTLFRNAEAALKKAKARGERYLFYDQKMTETVAAKLSLENQLRQALDKGEFVLHYQPKRNLASGKVTGAEALIRWNDPRTGLVPPGQFIPVLEETGLIYEVGRWALRKAVADYLRWRAAGLAVVRIAVNVSPLQLRNRGFVAEIAQVIGIDAHAPAGLELEITEGLIMEDIEHNMASLEAIRALGVTIAIDDFGTGFSSLSYLAKLPVDTLKIDRSFVVDMTAAQEGLALVSTIISLAHALRIKVVAEGVETEEQSRLLRLLACDEMQGFLFSKPVRAEIFEARFLSQPFAG